MSTTTITSRDQHEIFDHEIDDPQLTQDAIPTRPAGDDRMIDYMIAESREQRVRERRREAQLMQAHRRRTRGALATGTVAIVIAVGGTLLFLDGPSHGTGPQSSAGTPAAVVQPASAASSSTPASTITPASDGSSSVPASNITPATPAPGPSGNNTGNMGTGAGPSGNPQIPSGNNTGSMGSNGGPLNGAVSQ
jgi:hypothetical protein